MEKIIFDTFEKKLIEVENDKLDGLSWEKIRNDRSYKVFGFINEETFDISESGEESNLIWFEFYEMNKFLWSLLEKDSLKKIKDNIKRDVYYFNYKNYKKFVLKYLIKDLSFDIEIKRKETGELSEKTMKEISSLNPKILDYFLNKFDELIALSESETLKISEQCGLLFKSNSNGVKSPHEAISLYCELAGFWEKFGLNYYDISKLPIDVYNKLRLILREENEIKANELKGNKKTTSKGKGGMNQILDSQTF